MGIKKLFKIKPPEEDTPEQMKEDLKELGIAIKNPNKKRTEKFAAYGQYARERAADKFYAPEGYEAYATPQRQEEPEDLNRSALDDESVTAAAANDGAPKEKKDGKKRGLFRKKRSSQQPDSLENTTATDSQGIIDPYTVNPNASTYGSDPYGFNNTRNTNNNGYGHDSYTRGNAGANNLQQRAAPVDPYSSSDPYQSNSYNTTSDTYASSSRDPYQFNQTAATAPYNSTMNKNPQVSNTPALAESATGTNYYNINTRSDGQEPYRDVGNYTSSNYGSVSPGVRDSRYGALNNRNDNNDDNYGTRYEKNRSAVTSRSSAGDFSGNNTTGPLSASTATGVKNTQSPYSYSRPPAAAPGANPYAAMANDSYGVSTAGNLYSAQSASSSRSAVNPYYGRLTPSGRNTRQAATPSGSATALSNELDLNRSSVNNSSANIAALSDSAYDGGIDLNSAPSSSVVADDDLNADLYTRRQQQQQLQQIDAPQGYDNQFTFEQEQNGYGYGYGYGNGLAEQSKGYKTFEEIQREEEERQQQEEDEAVDELKQQIRFTKQSSVASTRNTLKMAQEAERSGMNTLGLLGHQSETLNNVERNLDLIKIQNTTADDKVAELKKLNRNILAIHVSNPFNSKMRNRLKEDQIKSRKLEEKMLMEQTSRNLAQSTQRITGALDQNEHTLSEVRDRYQRRDILERAKKYQFENDEEDDEMEVEIDRNLDKIQQISGRLKKLALATSDEIDAQQSRIRNIEENTDELDIKIHLNTTRLAGIR